MSTQLSQQQIFDTKTRSLRPFVPVRPGHVSMYVCGATPQAKPHIGHLRSAVAFDIVRRWFIAQGYDVAFVRNITDIDDKILAKAADNDRPWWEWVATHEREFTRAYDLLGVLAPSVEPRATGFVTQMVEYMQRLMDAGYAYAAAGSVYFDVVAWSQAAGSDYGELSGNRVAEMEQGETDNAGKRAAVDFALWKAVKPGEPAWPTPWGPGRPGWHLECSAMATYFLGSTFDIHGGGLDLQFPHHENEMAQSHAAGDSFAQVWMHNHWVTMAGEKMSKSLGNVMALEEMLELVRPVELRYYLGSAHYRSVLEYSEEALAEAAAGYRRIEDFIHRVQAAHQHQELAPAAELPADFSAAMNADFAVPKALAVIHTQVRAGNSALAAGDLDQALELATQVRAMAAILGCDPLAQPSTASATDDSARALAILVEQQLQLRTQARQQRDFATADQVRDVLAAAGISISDTPTGPTWSLG